MAVVPSDAGGERCSTDRAGAGPRTGPAGDRPSLPPSLPPSRSLGRSAAHRSADPWAADRSGGAVMSTSSDGDVGRSPSPAERIEALFRLHRPALLMCAEKVLGDTDPGAAEGVVQSALLLLLDKPGILPPDPADDVKSAMVTVRNLARNRRRKEEVRQAEPLSDADRRQDQHPLPAPQGGRVVRHREVGEAVSKLPEEERRVVELRFWRGMTYEAITAELGCSVRTAKRRWESAKRQLKGRLQ